MAQSDLQLLAFETTNEHDIQPESFILMMQAWIREASGCYREFQQYFFMEILTLYEIFQKNNS